MNISMQPDGMLHTYLRACTALWKVCYNAKYPITEDPAAFKVIDGKRYDIILVAAGPRHLRYAITTADGDQETKVRLEAQLICAYIATPPVVETIPLPRRMEGGRLNHAREPG